MLFRSGDYQHPNSTTLIKDDYEKYHLNKNDFFVALRGHLLTKKFLFLGLSFSDPNIDYILSRIRSSHGRNQPEHFCILRKIQKLDNEGQADFEYKQRKQQLFIGDLKRVGISVLLIDEYQEITEILRDVEQAQKRKTIFISGAAEDYSPYSQQDVEKFVSSLSQEILRLGYRIVTGFGLGIGSSVISGSIKFLTEQRLKIDEDYLIIRPFPQNKEGKELWTAWREDMIGYAGISIFLFGNKLEGDEIKPSNRKYPYVDFKPDREPGKEILQVKNISKTVDGIKIYTLVIVLELIIGVMIAVLSPLFHRNTKRIINVMIVAVVLAIIGSLIYKGSVKTIMKKQKKS